VKLKRIVPAVVLAAAVVASSAACSSRRIDPEETGSSNVHGTSWEMFCDGPNAVFWVPGLSGDPDELEAYVYDHYKCAPQFYAEHPEMTQPIPSQPDTDGINDDNQEDDK